MTENSIGIKFVVTRGALEIVGRQKNRIVFYHCTQSGADLNGTSGIKVSPHGGRVIAGLD